MPGLVERGGQGGVVQARAGAPSERDRGGVGGAQPDGVTPTSDGELVVGAGFPAQPHGQLCGIGLGRGDGDIGEQGAQQALAVFVAGGLGRPQHRQIGH